MNKLLTLITCLLTTFFTSAQTTGTVGNSLLWKISGHNLTKPSYLFGTIHIICRDNYLWTDKMKQSLELSEKICFEMDLDDPTVMMKLIDSSGKKLKDYFTPQEYEMIRRYFKDHSDIDISLFAQMKPIALQSLIATSSGPCAELVSYEETIMKEGLQEKKEILGLETPEEQLALLESIPTDSVVKELVEFVQHGDKQQDSIAYNTLISAYKKQDIAALYSLIVQSKESDDDMELFLSSRNKKWIARMTAKMKSNAIFFALGAGHLWGATGVIALLQKEGYTVEAVQ